MVPTSILRANMTRNGIDCFALLIHSELFHKNRFQKRPSQIFEVSFFENNFCEKVHCESKTEKIAPASRHIATENGCVRQIAFTFEKLTGDFLETFWRFSGDFLQKSEKVFKLGKPIECEQVRQLTSTCNISTA